MAGTVCLVILEDGQRKKISLPNGAYAELLFALRSLTDINDTTLVQMYDEELEDYVDLDMHSNIQNKAKIRLARRIAPEMNRAGPAFAVRGGSNTEMTQSSAVTECAEEVQHVQSVPLEKEKDYLDFVLPSFDHYEEVLRRKVPINCAVRRAIINKLFAACFKIAWYPSRQLYRVAAERLVSAYPHLADRVGSGNGLDSWVMALRNKFKNMRKKAENCSEEMLAKKRHFLVKRKQQVASGEATNKKLCRLFDCSHLVAYGETAESLRLHNEWLQDNAGCQDEEAVRPRLLATARERHDQLRSLTLSDALLLFPFLATEASLPVEFDLLFQRNVMEAMENGCKQLGYTILSFGEPEEIVAFSEVGSEDAVLAVLQFVAKRCKEPIDSIITQEEAPLTPCLVQDEGFALHIDKQLVFQVSSLLSGVACLFASFWVFYVEYPRKAHKMLTFIEHAFLNLTHTKPRVKALQLINFFRGHADSLEEP
ncbi:sterile alpha motif domain-containing protein 3-like [Dermacentor albipictus]|uniref:sterile alpha motif domain-containing protein 3-like n=1 Tax=Dermacentor albipictus TaxID=60249 RepID=UPI0038FCD63A